MGDAIREHVGYSVLHGHWDAWDDGFYREESAIGAGDASAILPWYGYSAEWVN